jgi:methylmalonyl-CoA mutase N-terminal domain/subunit
VNRCTIDEEERAVEMHPYKREEAERQIARLADIKANRDADEVKTRLSEVRSAAADGANVVPPIIAAVKALATVGEVTAVLKGVFGEYDEPIRF